MIDGAAMRRIRGIVCVYAAAGVLLPGIGNAEKPKLSSGVTVEVGEKKSYPFIVRPYREKVVFVPSNYELGKINRYAEPDIIAIKLLTLKSKGRVEEFYSYFSDKYEAEEYARLGIANEQDRSNVAKRWREKWEGVTVELSERVDFNIRTVRHAIIGYVKESEGEEGFAQFAFERSFDGINFEWLVVDLSDHPVSNNWNFEGARKVLRTERIYGQDGECEWASGSPCKDLAVE